jgi:hypothetical protein
MRVLADAGTRFAAWLGRSKIQRQLRRGPAVEQPGGGAAQNDGLEEEIRRWRMLYTVVDTSTV